MDFSVIPKVWVSNSPRASTEPGALQRLAAAVRAQGARLGVARSGCWSCRVTS